MATTDATPQTAPNWLLNEKKSVEISAKAKTLANLILSNPTNVLGGGSDVSVNYEVRKDLSLAPQLVHLLGFDKLIQDYKGQPYVEIPSGGDDILSKFEAATKGTEKGSYYPKPLAILFLIVSNGFPQEKAQALLDEVVKPRGENQTMLNYAFKGYKTILGSSSGLPDWVKERYLK